jgi:hypothetical protein
MKMKLRTLLVSIGLTTGATVGAFTMVSGISTVPEQPPEPTVTVEAPEPLILAPTAGNETAVFEYEVTGTERTASVELSSVDATETCLSVSLTDGRADVCFDSKTVSSGLSYGAFGEPDGTFVVVGVVPDEVDTVELAGRPVELTDNVWSTRLPTDSPAELRVGNSTTGSFITLAAAAES